MNNPLIITLLMSLKPVGTGQGSSAYGTRRVLYALVAVLVAAACTFALYQFSWSEKTAYVENGTSVGFVTQVHSKQNLHVFVDVRSDDLSVHRYDTGYAPLDCKLPRMNALLRVRVTSRESVFFGKDLRTELIDTPCRPQKT